MHDHIRLLIEGIEERIRAVPDSDVYIAMSYGTAKDLIEALKEHEEKSGEWLETPDGNGGEESIICPFCGGEWNTIDNCTETFDYCPKCGARLYDAHIFPKKRKDVLNGRQRESYQRVKLLQDQHGQ